MAHSSATTFPNNIDPRIYFSDISLQNTSILNGYTTLVSNGQYQQASQYLYDNIETPNLDIGYNGAYLWNGFDNRIESIENYALTMPETTARCVYSNTEPTSKPKGTVWVAS